ncbi:BH3-interacting domain death agonist isoform X2 [Passer domesticus]|uniref:BH3-interacting domain death agonist isoform X2 n=1 Tax=Passer domesticus TaxID=48849 RepID=UPI0030FE6365
MSQLGRALLPAPKLKVSVAGPLFPLTFPVAHGCAGCRQSQALKKSHPDLFQSPKEQDRGLSPARTLLRVEINGPLQMEHALLFAFLEVSSDCNFKDQLHSLQSQQIMLYQGDDDDELQTDGNRSGHFRNGELGLAPTNEEVIRIIAAQLAEIGDQFDKEIQERVVNGLVQHFMNENLSEEDITRHMSRVVRELIRAIPSDMEQEKAMLVLAMVLTKKIVNTVPSLLHRVFTTTRNYMNQQFHNYIVAMLGE